MSNQQDLDRSENDAWSAMTAAKRDETTENRGVVNALLAIERRLEWLGHMMSMTRQNDG